MWFLLLLLAHAEAVAPEAAARVILHHEVNACEGHIEVYYKNTWGYVGDTTWNTNVEKVVCRSTYCGEPVLDSPLVYMARPHNSTVWVNSLKCTGDEKHLFKCDFPGPNKSFYKQEVVRKINCSNTIKFSLLGSKCAGAVQYSINDDSSKGYFCNHKWTNREADLLCRSLGCGGIKEIPIPEWVKDEDFRFSKKMKIDCSDIKNVTNLWQCAIDDSPTSQCDHPASVICTGHERQQLRGSRSNVCSGQLEIKKGDMWEPVEGDRSDPYETCREMNCGTFSSFGPDNKTQELTCTDKVQVVLMDGNQESKCYGIVHMKVNDEIKPVCASNKWTDEEAKLVCRELGCGTMRQHSQRMTTNKIGIMDYVKCADNESSLWHCQAQHGNNLQCQSSPFIVCSGSVEMRLEDGPGRCAGRLEFQFEGKWKRVNKNNEWGDEYSDSVCSKLQCGKTSKRGKAEKFSQGSGTFVNLKCKQSIDDCTLSNTGQGQTVEITCEKHKVIFLNGSESCSGEVGIVHSDKTYWLSGSKTTWNQKSANIVCQQMHCGTALNYTFQPNDHMMDVWNETYDCSSTDKTLFECKERKLPSDHKRTIASVICSGNRNVTLSNGCWGTVNICTNEECGGVCGETWTNEKSVMLCQSLGCGDKVLKAHYPPKSGNVIFKSLHSTEHTKELSQCNFVRKKENDDTCDKNPAYVVCSGSIKPRFDQMSRYKCSGNVVVEYENRAFPVCKDALQDIDTQNAICRELNCGKALGRTLDFFGNQNTQANQPVISNLQCPEDNVTSLAACAVNSAKTSCTLGGLQCSEWKMMQISETCEGKVFVYSEGRKSIVSSQGWNELEGKRLCEDLQCGGLQLHIGTPRDEFPFWSSSFNCRDKYHQNIWDCEEQTPPPQDMQLFIKCQDKPSITLSETCHGELRIDNTAVCSSLWKNEFSHVVCQNMGCGNAVDNPTGVKVPTPQNKYLVKCDDHDYNFGQCERIKGKCDQSSLSIYCVDNIEFRIKDCGGVIEVKYKTEWEKVCSPTQLSDKMMDKLCNDLNCGGHNATVKSKKEKKEKLGISLLCNDDTFNLKYCVKNQPCASAYPAEIYCNAYEPPPPIEKSDRFPVEVVVVVLVLVLLVIVIIIIIRFRNLRRAKKSIFVSRMQSKKDVEVESGTYEDVVTNANEMEDLSHGKPAVVMENDAQSTSSLPYDDIDEMIETQPLTAVDAATTAVPRDGFTREDPVTYEVDDPKDNYDDIEASPEFMQTKAEVHERPRTEWNAAAPPGLEQRDEDYLEPDQDG